ncbi:MAG: S41 family peptidase [Chlorobiaceae bacterium]|nr:S41 family peptidase [Chlorobiaceae bacterium]
MTVIRLNLIPVRLRGLTAAALAAAAMFTGMPAVHAAAAVPAKPDWFAAGRSIELLGEVYREVAENYVDPVDVSELMAAGIDGMLEKLDPYTDFLDESGTQELDELTTGHYAGIGITISIISGDLCITSVIEGNAASKAGLLIGDRIVSVNGVRVRNRSIDDVRAAIKGAVGSNVRLGIERPGRRGSREYLLRRAEVRVDTVGYAGLFGAIGYIGMNSFAEHSCDELRGALQSLLQQAAAGNGPLKGIVLDLRGNPGGLLNAAVDVAAVFLEKGSKVVSTIGRGAENSQVYLTGTEPLVPLLPFAVLIDGDSASASEIVAGAIQEHDRGLIIGEVSFGKGLVQSIVNLPYDHVLKLTTSKYHTPSGRLIQKPLPHQEGGRKVVIGPSGVDSTRAYYTDRHRKVFGGGGIRPDVIVRATEHSAYEHALDRKGLFFKYASRYRASHDRADVQDLQQGRLLADFGRFVDSERFTYRSRSQQTLDSLKVIIRKEYGRDGDGLALRLGDLEKELTAKSSKGLAGDSVRVATAVRQELLRHFDEKRARKAAIEADPVAAKAFSLLSDPAAYRSLLGR